MGNKEDIAFQKMAMLMEAYKQANEPDGCAGRAREDAGEAAGRKRKVD